MRTFWVAFAGGFFGKLLAGLFIAVCILLGIGPDKWASYMVQELPGWITPAIARIVFLTLGMITALFLWKNIKREKLSLKNVANESADEALVHGFNHASSRRVSTKEGALLLLTQLRTEGVVIRNDASKIYYTGDLDGWTHKVTEWMKDVIEALKPLSNTDSEWFATLDVVPPARVRPPHVRLGGDADGEMFIAIFNQHDYRLARLDNLLKKHGVAA